MERGGHRRLGWRGGILLVVIAIIVGTLVGVLIDRAQADPATPADSAQVRQLPPCDACYAKVRRPRQGARKYRHDRLGRAHRMRYTSKQKRIIVHALAKARRRLAREHPTARLARASQAQLWRNFTAHDSCYYRVNPGPPNTATWSCDGGYRSFPDDADWTGDDVDGAICSGLAGITVAGALAAGAGGPWLWAGLGAGWAACVWQDNLHDYANSH
jgi:hypothetical protein